MIKIALAGQKGGGKDTVKEILEELIPCHTISFSDHLKKIACELFPWMNFDYPHEEKETRIIWANPETGEEFTPRDVWQKLDILVQIDPSILINPYKNTLKMLERSGVNVLVKDVRRPWELKWVKENGFYFVYICTSDKSNHYSGHISESFQDLLSENADFHFVNKHNGLDRLRQDLAKFLKEHREDINVKA